MHVVVCLKPIIDPEIPLADFRIDRESKRIIQGNANLVTNIFDENALETALQMRERAEGDIRITAISIGTSSSIDILRRALSLRADQAILINNEGMPELDTFATAKILAAALRRLAPIDLILCGREAGDWHGGQVGSFLAEELSWPCATFVSRIDIDGEHFIMRRQTDDGWEVVKCQRPAIATVTNDETNVPRIPKVRDSMMAFRKEIPIWNIMELGIDVSAVRDAHVTLQLRDMYIPEVNKRCSFIEGEVGKEKAIRLLHKLREMHII